MKNRMVALFLSLVMVCSIVGCGSTAKDQGDTKTNEVKVENETNEVKVENETTDKTIGLYNWPVDYTLDYSEPYYKRFDGEEISVVMQTAGDDLPEGQTVEENEWTWVFEAVTGLKTKVLWHAGGDAYDPKWSAAIASGELPDIMNVDYNTYIQMVEYGYLADITDYMDIISPTLKSLYEANGRSVLNDLMVDGRLYGIPQVYSLGDGANEFWIRKDWLDKLGLEEPKTYADLEAIALAFMEQDPDGNGQDDTYGIGAYANYDSVYGGSLSSVFLTVGGGAPNCWQEEDGKVIYGSLMDGNKETLKLLNSWYEKGILTKDFATWTKDDMTAAITNEKMGILSGLFWAQLDEYAGNLTANAEAEWVACLMPYKEGGAVRVCGGNPIVSIFVANKDIKDPSMLVYACNNYNDSQYMSKALADHGQITLNGAYRIINYSNPPRAYDIYADMYEKGLSGELTSLEEAQDYVAQFGMQSSVAAAWSALPVLKEGGKRPEDLSLYQTYLLWAEGIGEYVDAGVEYVTPIYQGTTKSMEMYKTFLDTFEKDAYTKMIMGETDGMSIDEYFDKFVEDYLAQGGADITAEVQAVIDAR